MTVRNRDIVYVLKMRNAARGDIAAFARDIRKAAADARKALQSIGGLRTSPLAGSGNQAAQAATEIQRAMRAIITVTRQMASQARVAIDAAIRDHNKLIASAQRMRAALGRPIQQGRIIPNTGRIGSPGSGAAAGARVAAVTGMGGGAGAGLIGGGLLVGLTVTGIANMADSWQNLENRLIAVGVASENVGATQKQILGIAQRSRADLDAVGKTYTRLMIAGRELGANQAQIARVTETLSKSMTMGGASTQETQGALLQLSQALASGTLNGDELRSLMENAPLVAQAIADAMGVGIDQLKKLGSEGKLTSDIVLKAVLGMSKEVDEAFAKMSPTFAQTWQQLSNAATKYVGELNKAVDGSSMFANAMSAVIAVLERSDPVIDGVVAALAGLVAILTGRALISMAGMFVAALGPIGLVAAAIAGLIGYFVAIRNETVTLGSNVATLGSVFQTVWGDVREATAKFVVWMVEAFNGMVDTWTGRLVAFAGSEAVRFLNELARTLRQLDRASRAAKDWDFGTAVSVLWRWDENEKPFDDWMARVGERASALDTLKKAEEEAAKVSLPHQAPYDTSNIHWDAPDKDADKREKAREREIKSANEAFAQHVRQLRAAEVTTGLYGDELERVTQLLQFEQQLLGMENLTQAERELLLKRYNEELVRHIANVKAQETAYSGMNAALAEYALETGNAFDNAKEMMGNTLSSVEDALTEFMTRGKLDWRSFVQSLIADFMRMRVVQPLLGQLAPEGGRDTAGRSSFLGEGKSAGQAGAVLAPDASSIIAPQAALTAPVDAVERKPLPALAPIDDASRRVAEAFEVTAQNLQPVSKIVALLGRDGLVPVDTMTAYIREAASARNIDPDIAVRVARSEGLSPGIWQAGYVKNGYREPSYGPFQLLKGGKGTGFPTGMGNDFQRQTGLDPADPRNSFAGVDFALNGAAKNGWGAWYGAAKAGVGKWDGLGGARTAAVSTVQTDPKLLTAMQQNAQVTQTAAAQASTFQSQSLANQRADQGIQQSQQTSLQQVAQPGAAGEQQTASMAIQQAMVSAMQVSQLTGAGGGNLFAQPVKDAAPQIQSTMTGTMGNVASNTSSQFGNVFQGLGGMFSSIFGGVFQGLGGILQSILGGAGGGGGAGIFSAITSILGFSQGGYTGNGGVQQAAGIVHGKEFVVNAAATRKHRDLLEAINAGKAARLGFSKGGYVDPLSGPSSPALALPAPVSAAPVPSAGSMTFAPTISVTVEGGSKGKEQDEKAGQAVSKQIQRALRAEMAEFMRQQMRPGNALGPGGRRR